MSEIHMMTVKTGFDPSGLLDMEKKTLAMLESLRGRLSRFNGGTSLKPDTREFLRELEKIKQELDNLTKERKSTLAKLDSHEFRKELTELENRLRAFEEEGLTIALNEGELEKTLGSLDSLKNRMDEAARNLTEGASVRPSWNLRTSF